MEDIDIVNDLIALVQSCGKWHWPLTDARVTVKAFGCVCVFLTGVFKGVCKNIDHFPEDADYEQDAAEYLLREYLQMLDIQLKVKHIQ